MLKTKLKITAALATLAILATSCYTTKLYMGNTKPGQPTVEVNKKWNHHIIAGLVPVGNNKLHPQQLADGAENYVAVTSHSFINGLISILTCAIYTPTTTTIYVPYNAGQTTENPAESPTETTTTPQSQN